MANLLITGNVKNINGELAELLGKYFTVTAAGKCSRQYRDHKVKYFDITPLDEKFSRLFDVYSFQTVVYFSAFAEHGGQTVGEMEKLQETLRCSSRASVEKVIVISTWESLNFVPVQGSAGEYLKKKYYGSTALRAGQLEELCDYYREWKRMKIILLRCPYLVDEDNEKNYLWTLFREAESKKGKIRFPHTPGDRVDFLTAADLAGLLVNIAEEREDTGGNYWAGSGNAAYYSQLEEKLKEMIPQTAVEYRKMPVTAQLPQYPRKLRSIYGFIPNDNVLENIERYYRKYRVRRMQEEQKRSEHPLARLLRKLFPYLELILVFWFAEWLNRLTGVSVYFKLIDFRLLFVVIMATVYGMKMGILAALLECLAVGNAYLRQGADFNLLFYNIENWLPFVFYLMAGTVTGYVKNQKNDEIAFSREENRLIREKYTFLNQAYQGAIENKGEYKRQILGFQDSFGKIFSAVQRLDSLLPESIYLEGLKIFEDILQNHTVAIYSLDQWQKFGRLSVCSVSMLQRLPKSIRMEEYQEMYECIRAGGVFKNTKLLADYPMYASGIFQGDRIRLLVILYEANVQQMGRNYANIFQILCGLMQSSFLRALDYETREEQNIYFADTNVMKPERFRIVCRLQEEIREAGFADYLLVKFAERDKRLLSESVSGIIRSSDTLGADEEGNLYVLLAQANRENFVYVRERFDRKGLAYKIVETIGEEE